MKIIVLFFMFTIVIQSTGNAQQIDDNSLAINNYFQITSEQPDLKENNHLYSDRSSYSNVIQSGDENSIYINSLQFDDNQVVKQNGNQNNYEYYNYYSKENSNLKVNQEGNQNSLQVFGENSLMKNAVINQKSDFKSIVIKNYAN